MSKFLARMSSFFVLFMLLTSFDVMAQTSKGFIVGDVKDSNGSAIQGATIKITNAQTGVTRETVSGNDGQYRFDAIDPGTYRVEVNATGFSSSAVNDVVVASAQTTETPIALSVGAASAIVEINSGDVVLETTDGARVNTLSRRQITDLPVAGLNPANLILTLPGVVSPGPLAGGFVQGTEVSVNGLRARANNQLLDGLDNNDNAITGQSYQPVLRDGFGEVAILSSNYSAEYGRAGGAITNVITRNGANKFSGSVYDVITSSSFSSLSSYQKTVQNLTKPPVTIENDYGFSIGGPIIKNKLFFFGTIQNSPFRGNTNASATVPTQVGFNQLRALFPAGTSANLDYYLNIVGDLRAPVANRTVAIGGGAAPIEFGIASRAYSQTVDDKQYLARFDFTPTSKDSFNARYLADKQRFVNQIPSAFTGFNVDVPSLVQNVYAGYTRNISANLTNEFRFGYGRFNVLFTPSSSSALNGPTIAIVGSNITGVGLPATFPQGRLFNNYQFQDTVSYTIGRHSIRTGFDVLAQKAFELVPINTRGSLSFSSNPANAATGTPATTAFRNFIDGFSGTQGVFASRVFGDTFTRPNVTRQAYFINDNYRAVEGLTFNLGLRYEYFGEVANSAKYPAFAGLFAPLLTRVEQKADKNNFAPRISFAYSPKFGSGFANRIFGEDTTVFRGGFAINYDVFFNNILDNTSATSPNALGGDLRGGLNGDSTRRGIANAGLNTLPTSANLATAPLATVNTIDPNLKNPESYVFSFGIQRKLPGDLIAEVGYVGTRGRRLFINEQLNPGIDGVNRLNQARGGITVRTNGGDSKYDSLQARLEKGFKNGLLFRVAYTFSKAIDDVNSEVFVTTGGSSVGSQNFDRTLDRGLASFDVPHRLVASFLYDIPSPIQNKVGRALLGGFTLSGIYTIQSGNVETPYIGGFDINGDLNAFNDRPAIYNSNAPATSVAFSNDLNGTASPTGYSDVNGNDISLANSRYVVDSNLRTNIAGRNTLRSPKFTSLDLSLIKSFRLPFVPLETSRFQVRADFFNVLNKPSFAFDLFVSDGNVLDPNFNQPRLNNGTSRSGRIQVRYSF